ncbi:hypothetical protein GCM10010430_66570 [Kitasatospora cystarginea]|uniref:Uncharacterized protein n=1 Tax=Kitasatospora cystarginea TaxID=58350 RepID=A0ABN3EUA9_9ACTN
MVVTEGTVAVELPCEVVSFLQFIGINWPTVNEDKVREFASHVREFAGSPRYPTRRACSGRTIDDTWAAED